MNNAVFKTNEAAVVNHGEAMESDTIQKNGESSKSQRSRYAISILIASVMFAGFFVFNACDEEEKTGSVGFYTLVGTAGKFEITLKGDKVDQTKTLDKWTVEGFTCGDNAQSVVFSNLAYGKYTYTATYGTEGVLTGEVKIDKDCQSVKLTPSNP